MDRFLKLPLGELGRVAEAHRKEELKRRLGDTAPLFPDLRDLLLRKCAPDELEHVRAIFEHQPFGELERLVARQLRQVAGLDSDVLHITPKQRERLDAMIASWAWDAATFALEIKLSGRTVGWRRSRFEYAEREEPVGRTARGVPADRSLSGTATPEELAI
jgi:hypothetical protein